MRPRQVEYGWTTGGLQAESKGIQSTGITTHRGVSGNAYVIR
jgi:hypothetical protein